MNMRDVQKEVKALKASKIRSPDCSYRINPEADRLIEICEMLLGLMIPADPPLPPPPPPAPPAPVEAQEEKPKEVPKRKYRRKAKG